MRYRYWPYAVERSAMRPDGILYRPMVPIRITGRFGHANLLALLDSGADDTLFSRSIGEAIAARMDEISSWAVHGIGGEEIGAARGEVEIEISEGRTLFA